MFESLWPPWTTARQASLSFIVSQSLLKLMSIELVMPSNHLILCRPLLLLPSIFPSIRLFSSESALHIRWPEYWSFSFSVSPSNEYSGLISFRIDWFGSPCSPRDSQEFSSTTVRRHQFFDGSALISIHDYWRNHSSDYTDLFWQKFWQKLAKTKNF